MIRRLGQASGEAIDRTRTVHFQLDGKPVEAYQGDTIASAMAAAGVVVTGRSFKYHRPRGLFCLTGACANCMVRVDGVPNVQACQTPVSEGMRVARQNGLPSVDFDMMRMADLFSAFLPAGFYYKAFYRPRFMWPLVEPFIRRAAGLGTAPDEEAGHRHYEARNLHPDVLVVGGGPAGMAAAAEAARAGARTMLVDSEPMLGGHLRSTMLAVRDPENAGAEPGQVLAARLGGDVAGAGVDVWSSTTAFGIFEHNLVAAAAPEGLLRIRPRQIVIATGGLEQPLLFGNADLPGIMLAGAAERMINLYRVLPGSIAVVLTGSTRGYDTARALLAAGARVTILDWRAHASGPEVDAAVKAGAEQLTSAVATKADGNKRVRGLEAQVAGQPRRFVCDLVVVAGAIAPAAGLLAQAGARAPYDEKLGAFVPDRLPEGIHAAGGVLSESDLGHALVSGRLAGLAAASAAVDADIKARRTRLTRLAKTAERSVLPTAPHIKGGGKTFTCLCMDVTTKEMELAVEEGFDSIELLKRYTALGMGPCQGKSCLAGCVRFAARLTGRSVPETGVPTSRAPWRPVELGLLAADHLEPRKESPLHESHADLGAEFLWAGEWRRPHHYSDPAAECKAVHERVAIIDVSTLGKFRISGPDSVALLERLYPNRYGDLKVGRIRYGAMLNDQGVILDDGTVGRLGENEFFVTTTTTGAEAIDQWIKWWMADWRLNAHVLNVSSAYAAINVAGPRSRELMARLTDTDVSAAGLPYLKLAQATVAGVPALVLRIGFVGELSYEVHFPGAYSEYVWESMLEAGADLGVLPFGLESQRILRLEKQHIIVSQDTDALSTPFGAGLGWMVKLDKDDFLGRAALADDSTRGIPEKLVGFKVVAGGLPLEGAAIVAGGTAVGRVCSSRWSDAVQAYIGLAWVPTEMAEEGTLLDFRSGGKSIRAQVELKPFYDPDGSRLRS
jgi:sarcosine oxidase subunit alpha